MPMHSPTAWVYLPSGDCTIRWQREETVAYIFEGKHLENDPAADPLATIPVSATGWTDMAEVRLAGENWVKARRRRCRTCGVYS